MQVGCYTLDLYCENYKNDGFDGIHEFKEFPHQFTAELGRTCRKHAKEKGWILYNDGRAYCPKCNKNMIK